MPASLAAQVAALTAQARAATHLRTGVVHTASPLAVDLGGATSLPADRLAGYTPVVADIVLIAQTEGRLVVLDKLA